MCSLFVLKFADKVKRIQTLPESPRTDRAVGARGADETASEGSEDEDSAELMEYISELCSNMAISMNEILTEVSNLTRQRMSILI